MDTHTQHQPLRRSDRNRVVGGVCGGLGDYFGIDPIIFRIVFVVLVLGAGSGLLLYLVAWVAIPRNKFWDPAPPHSPRLDFNRALAVGSLLVALGILLLLDGPLGWIRASVGPLILIALGVVVLLNRRRS